MNDVLTEREKTFHRLRDHASEHKAHVRPYVSVCQLRFVQELSLHASCEFIHRPNPHSRT